MLLRIAADWSEPPVTTATKTKLTFNNIATVNKIYYIVFW